MKAANVAFSLCILCAVHVVSAQVYLPLQNNWQIQSDSWIKVAADTYRVSDPEWDGVIQIVNRHNVIIDGDSVEVHGYSFTGYFINILNSDSVTIRNFRWADSMFYAVNVRHSRNVIISNCTFSNNRKDSVGFIDVWTDVDQALGGGVLMDSCSSCTVSSCMMKNANDGVALYHCDSITVGGNDLSWNTSYGVRMYWTDHSSIHDNICSHTNRLTDQSDCGAILLIVSNGNRVERNDLTYSGDGIFLGQYQHDAIPNNNYFAYNDGSYSPHNAFEATFASGNVFKHNVANHSDYGFWLGYSFNTVVDSNEIMNNQTAGVAIDRGFHNSFRGDTLVANPTGIWLWEGPPISPYTGWTSHDYLIDRCEFAANSVALSASNTAHLVMSRSSVTYNANGLHFDGSAPADTIMQCVFDRSILFHIENASPDNMMAAGNDFSVGDSALIDQKIFDRSDDATSGTVFWRPFQPGPAPLFEYAPPGDLAEPPSVWTVYASDGRTTTASWDSANSQSGSASLKITTASGFDVFAQYWPEGDRFSSWDLSNSKYVYVWFKADNINTFQANSIRLGNNSGGYFSYDAPSSILSGTIGAWKKFIIPLSGDATWVRTAYGTVSLSKISYVQIHADTWDFGFTLWVDGLSFVPAPAVVASPEVPARFDLGQNFPNPFNPSTTIGYRVQGSGYGVVTLKVFDMLGREVAVLVSEKKHAGSYEVTFDAGGLASGVYFYRLTAGPFTQTRKMVVMK